MVLELVVLDHFEHLDIDSSPSINSLTRTLSFLVSQKTSHVLFSLHLPRRTGNHFSLPSLKSPVLNPLLSPAILVLILWLSIIRIIWIRNCQIPDSGLWEKKIQIIRAFTTIRIQTTHTTPNLHHHTYPSYTSYNPITHCTPHPPTAIRPPPSYTKHHLNPAIPIHTHQHPSNLLLHHHTSPPPNTHTTFQHTTPLQPLPHTPTHTHPQHLHTLNTYTPSNTLHPSNLYHTPQPIHTLNTYTPSTHTHPPTPYTPSNTLHTLQPSPTPHPPPMPQTHHLTPVPPPPPHLTHCLHPPTPGCRRVEGCVSVEVMCSVEVM